MHLIPHSYPYLTKSDNDNVATCFQHEYIGYDTDLESILNHEFNHYVSYKYIEVLLW